MSYKINKVGESAVLENGKKYVAVADPEYGSGVFYLESFRISK